MKKAIFILLICFILAGPHQQQRAIEVKAFDATQPVELKFAPSDCVYIHHDLYNSLTRRHYYDLILHTISVVNSSKKPVRIDKVKIEAVKDDKLIQCKVLSNDEILRVSIPLLEQMGGELQPFLNLILWTDKVIPPEFEPSSDLNIKPKSALLIFNTFLSFSSLPDELRMSATGTEANGENIEAKGSLAVIQYQNKVKYSLPLEGSWFMRGMPANGVLDHHRFGIPNEFGVDFCRVGPNGEAFRNEGKEASDYYGFGEKVLAAADGVVAAVNNSAVQEWTRFNPDKGESSQEYQERFFEEVTAALKGNVRNWVGGNYVIIKHAEGEYSSYFHLKEKSVRVKVGDKVQRGQHIGDVGNTGDSFEVHLHFQVNDSDNFANGRSLPFSFEDIQTEFHEPGRFVKFKK
jgi:hypothetical protein